MNELEIALHEASKDSTKQAAFYEVLSRSKVYFIPHGRAPETIDGKAIEGQKIAIQNVMGPDGQVYAPFFSSLQALQSFITKQVTYLETESLPFFDLIKGGQAILNPGLEFGKYFFKQEIIDILNGDAGKKRSQIVIEEKTEIKIGKPANYPNELAKQLSQLYKSLPEVNEAHLAWVQMEKDGEKPHLMIMLTTSGPSEEPFEKSGQIVNQWLGEKKEYVDFVSDTRNGVSSLVRTSGIKFYKKKRFGIF